MAETKEKKGFNAALYAVIAGIVVAVLLVLITIFAYNKILQALLPKR